MLKAGEARTLLDSIDASSLIGLRGRALIGLMDYIHNGNRVIAILGEHGNERKDGSHAGHYN